MRKYLIIAICFTLVWSTYQTVNGQSGPNLLIILTDDQRDNTFSGMGHPWVKTPHMDMLLTQGVRFENTYIAEPTCNPSRAALMLGCHERINRQGFSIRHGMNESQWSESYPVLLQQAGYKTGFVGKWHISTRLELETLFDFWEGQMGHGQFYYETADSLGNMETITCNRKHTDRALEFLERQSGDTPFCLSLCYATPHGSKVIGMNPTLNEQASKDPRLKDHPIYGGSYGGMYRDVEISYPLQDPENPYQFIPKWIMDQDSGRNKIYRYDYDPVMNREHHYRYYQMITELDQMIGELVVMLREKELYNNTIIIFGSDHGLLMGEYGMGGKALLYGLTTKIPCVVFDPAAPAALRGSSRKELVSSLDLPVTILDYAGVSPGPFMTGRSLKPLIQGKEPKAPWREGLFLENMYTGRDTPLQEGYVDGEWKYIRYFKVRHPYHSHDVENFGRVPDFEALFSLKKDPGEKNNLVRAPEHQDKLVELREKCDAELETILGLRQRYGTHHDVND